MMLRHQPAHRHTGAGWAPVESGVFGACLSARCTVDESLMDPACGGKGPEEGDSQVRPSAEADRSGRYEFGRQDAEAAEAREAGPPANSAEGDARSGGPGTPHHTPLSGS